MLNSCGSEIRGSGVCFLLAGYNRPQKLHSSCLVCFLFFFFFPLFFYCCFLFISFFCGLSMEFSHPNIFFINMLKGFLLYELTLTDFTICVLHQTVSDLEAQVHSLRKELLAAHSQRKQQLMELGLLREEERQRSAHDQQTALEWLRSEMDQVRQDLEKTHKAERELAQEKNNSRMKHLEKEYSQRLAKSAQVIAERQMSLSTVKEESRKVQQSLERKLEEAQSQRDEERRQLNIDADQTSKCTKPSASYSSHPRALSAVNETQMNDWLADFSSATCIALLRKQTVKKPVCVWTVFQERVETLQKQLHTAEKKMMSRELENQEQITHVRQECELKIKGLMPAELRQELEDTITSLKSQVNFLHKRAAVLQEELSAGNIMM
ncbi:putative centrosomal protein of 112 kDa [Triplophysa rosa]|uniref:Centrosomal protein of 112 kDa n=1 Tax=Triplophysa rosa TaxID=992332 RepID=A0A9W7T2N5_TRIRA|nr:putative centrosomal protein of 112 kDa [Triplophysa rosa]